MRFFLKRMTKFCIQRTRKKKKVARPLSRTTRLNHRGEHHNLKELYDKINSQYFEGKLDLPITWAGSKKSMPRTHVMFGSYNQRTTLIKIHRRLDQAHVPEHFVSFIIYHEMLHHVLPPIIEKNRRRKVHHPKFTEQEKRFQDYALAKAFREKMRDTFFKPNIYK